MRTTKKEGLSSHFARRRRAQPSAPCRRGSSRPPCTGTAHQTAWVGGVRSLRAIRALPGNIHKYKHTQSRRYGALSTMHPQPKPACKITQGVYSVRATSWLLMHARAPNMFTCWPAGRCASLPIRRRAV